MRFGFILALLIGLGPMGWAQVLQTEPQDLEQDSIRQTTPVREQNAPAFVPQKFLALDKPGKIKRVRFFVGQEITFRLKNDPITYRDYITAIDDSSFTIFGTKVPIRDVDRIILRSNSWFVNQGSVLLPAAGVIYFLADNLNPVIQGNEGFSVSRGSVVVAAGLVGTGIILRIFAKRSHKIGNNKRLRVLETF